MFKAPVLKFCVVAPSTILTEAVELFLAILIVTGVPAGITCPKVNIIF